MCNSCPVGENINKLIIHLFIASVSITSSNELKINSIMVTYEFCTHDVMVTIKFYRNSVMVTCELSTHNFMVTIEFYTNSVM